MAKFLRLAASAMTFLLPTLHLRKFENQKRFRLFIPELDSRALLKGSEPIVELRTVALCVAVKD